MNSKRQRRCEVAADILQHWFLGQMSYGTRSALRKTLETLVNIEAKVEGRNLPFIPADIILFLTRTFGRLDRLSGGSHGGQVPWDLKKYEAVWMFYLGNMEKDPLFHTIISEPTRVVPIIEQRLWADNKFWGPQIGIEMFYRRYICQWNYSQILENIMQLTEDSK
jgi:hypothetical protein